MLIRIESLVWALYLLVSFGLRLLSVDLARQLIAFLVVVVSFLFLCMCVTDMALFAFRESSKRTMMMMGSDRSDVVDRPFSLDDLVQSTVLAAAVFIVDGQVLLVNTGRFFLPYSTPSANECLFSSKYARRRPLDCLFFIFLLALLDSKKEECVERKIRKLVACCALRSRLPRVLTRSPERLNAFGTDGRLLSLTSNTVPDSLPGFFFISFVCHFASKVAVWIENAQCYELMKGTYRIFF